MQALHVFDGITGEEFQRMFVCFKAQLKEYGMTQSMSRVSRCIDNGPCESFQGRFKDILFVKYRWRGL